MLVENFRPGVMNRLGLSFDEVSKINPRIVYGSISGFGSDIFGESPYKNWPSDTIKKDKSQKDVEQIINIISELRSFKNELNVSPGSFIDLSMNKIAKKNRSLMDNNEIILKKLGRINNFFEKDQDRPSATLVISGDIFKIYFDENVDLSLIKENLLKRQTKYQDELDKISQRLSNKGFVDRAPKNIVEQEKTNYSNLKNDIKKISLTIESL